MVSVPSDSNLTEAQRRVIAELNETMARLLDVQKRARELLKLKEGESVCAQCYDPDYPCPSFRDPPNGSLCTRETCRHHLEEHLIQ